MSEDLFLNKYRIKSARYPLSDYSNGTYFVTICSANREHYFGEIKNTEIVLSDIGLTTKEGIDYINNNYSYAKVPLYVIMPNHIHAIITIEENICSTVETGHAPSHKGNCIENMIGDGACSVSTKMREISNSKGLLSVVIGSLKAFVTKYANENNVDFSWQTRFHDHIIRNIDELNLISSYIENNIINWENDCFN